MQQESAAGFSLPSTNSDNNKPTCFFVFFVSLFESLQNREDVVVVVVVE
jgi:hypothetical protein